MDAQSLGRIKRLAQQNRKNIRKSYLVKGRDGHAHSSFFAPNSTVPPIKLRALAT